jgi:hypothetical protein
MKSEHIDEALNIIKASNSPKISLRVPIKDSYSNVHSILIHKSNSALISNLIKAGFSLHMTKKGLAIEKF